MRTTLENNLAYGLRLNSSKYGTVSQTLTGDYTILPDGPTINVFNTGSAVRNVNLPVLSAYGGQLYLISNTGTFGMTVRDADGVTVETLDEDESGLFFSVATGWQVLKTGGGGSGGGITTEDAQDAVGAILLDSSTIDFTYSDATPSITAIVKDGSLSFSKLASIATDKLVGRDTAGSGAPEEIGVTGGLEFTGSQAIQIATAGVSSAKLRDSAALTVIGRAANSTGVPADIAAVAASGAVLRESGSALGFGTVATAGIADDAVTFAKLVGSSAASKLVGRGSASGAGDFQEITLGTNITMAGTTINVSSGTATLGDGDYGDITVSAAGTVMTIDNDVVTFAKMQNVSAASKLLGRGSASGSGDVEEITLGSGLSMSGTTLTASGGATPTLITVANEAADTTCFIGFWTAATGDLGPKSNANMTFNAATGVATFASAILTTAVISGGTLNNVVIGGTTAAAATVTTLTVNTNANPDTNDGAALGTVALGWSDLFLADGGVLDWGNGGVTLTHVAASDSLTLSLDSANLLGSTSFNVQIDGISEITLNSLILAPGVNDGLALGSTALGWADLHLATGGVINWANGEVTLTETDANTLTLAGASSLLLGTTTALGLGTVELGHASDTTLARTGAGDFSVEGNQVYRAGGTDVPLADGGTGASLADPNADRFVGWDDSAGVVKFFALADLNAYATPVAGDKIITLKASNDLVGVDWDIFANQKIAALEFVIDGGGSVITTGIKGDLEVPFACTITRVTQLADQSGSIVVDIWKDTYANYPPVVGDSITAAAKPTISATTKSQDSTLTGWTTSVAAGDILRFNVDSVTTLTRVTVSLRVTKT